jgi:dynamin GTPase
MLSARRKEKEYFESSPEYGHLAHKMGAEYLAKLLSQVRAFCCCGMLLTINF